jgi:hypothetical protein
VRFGTKRQRADQAKYQLPGTAQSNLSTSDESPINQQVTLQLLFQSHVILTIDGWRSHFVYQGLFDWLLKRNIKKHSLNCLALPPNSGHSACP